MYHQWKNVAFTLFIMRGKLSYIVISTRFLCDHVFEERYQHWNIFSSFPIFIHFTLISGYYTLRFMIVHIYNKRWKYHFYMWPDRHFFVFNGNTLAHLYSILWASFSKISPPLPEIYSISLSQYHGCESRKFHRGVMSYASHGGLVNWKKKVRKHFREFRGDV